MTRVRCAYAGCAYWERHYCIAEEIELDAEEGCLTRILIDDLPIDDEEWEDLFSSEDEGVFDEDGDGYDPDEWN